MASYAPKSPCKKFSASLRERAFWLAEAETYNKSDAKFMLSFGRHLRRLRGDTNVQTVLHDTPNIILLGFQNLPSSGIGIGILTGINPDGSNQISNPTVLHPASDDSVVVYSLGELRIHDSTMAWEDVTVLMWTTVPAGGDLTDPTVERFYYSVKVTGFMTGLFDQNDHYSITVEKGDLYVFGDPSDIENSIFGPNELGFLVWFGPGAGPTFTRCAGDPPASDWCLPAGASTTVVYSFINKSPFYLSLDHSAGDGYCTATAGSPYPAVCEAVVAPNQTQSFSIPPGCYSFYLGYKAFYTNALQAFAGYMAVFGNRTSLQAESTVLTVGLGAAVDGVYPLTVDLLVCSPALPTPRSYGAVLPYRGVNFSGMDFSPFYPPNLCNTRWFTTQGCNTYRLPVFWEYLQDDTPLGSPIDFTKGCAWGYAEMVDRLTASGATVIVDMHNYMHYDPEHPGDVYNNTTHIIGADGPTTAQYAAAWASIAERFALNPRVLFDLMNEPHDVPTENILTAYNAAIAAIRLVETTVSHTLLLCGNQWACMGAWLDNWYGTANSAVFLPANIHDPGNNYALNVHQYLNLDRGCGSGAGNCNVTSPATILADIKFSDFVAYLKANNLKAFLSEVGCINDPNCISTMNALLSAVVTAADDGTGGFIGFTAWSAGSWASTYVMDLNPSGDVPAPQFAGAIQPHILAL